jgi:acyl-CoA thioesterase I
VSPTPSTLRRRRTAAVLAAAALVLGACTGDGKGDGPAATDEADGLYVAVGASESVGEGADDPTTQAWTQVFFRTALPRGYRFVNLGIPGATVAQALTEELPEALRLEPSLVTVWLNVNDIVRQVPADRYESQLKELVHALRRDGKTEVYVANTPPLDLLPVARGLGGLVTVVVGQYNAAIARVVKDEGAHLVDLHAAGEAARARGDAATLVAADGFHPSTAGHAAVGAEFAAVYRATAKQPAPG